MASTKLKLGLTTLVIVGTATILVIQHQTQTKLHEENQSLRQQIAQLKADTERLSNRVAQPKGTRAPRLPAPPMQVTTPPAPSPTEDLHSTNRIAQLIHKPPKLTAEQVGSYLKANRRNAASLLAAYRTTGNPALLEEAMQKYPNDPQVDFEAAVFEVRKEDASPGERRQWLDAFKQSAPENALANYLSALDYFKGGQTDQAVQEITAASDKPQFQNYPLDRVQDDEEAYLAAGYSVAEAAAIAHAGLPRPDLQPLRVLARDCLVPLANSYQQVGDEESAQAALQMGWNVGERLKGSAGQLIDNMMGFAIQRAVLLSMDPNSPYGSTGQTVQNQYDAVVQQQVTLGRFVGDSEDNLLPTLSDQELVNFFNRVKLFGEAEAARWLAGKYGQQ